MHTLFDLDAGASLPTRYAGGWHYVRAGLQANLEKATRFYQRSPMAVKSDHLLIRLLQSITIPKSLPIERYYDNVDGLYSLNLAMAMKMTSSIYLGHVFPGIFYGPGCDEVIIAHAADFNAREAEKNWWKLKPIEVLRHPRSDLGLLLPDGKATGSEYGIAIIAINVPMLAVQYRSWWIQEQYWAERNGDSPMGINQFIHMVVLPGMLSSQLDYTLFNRFRNLVTGAPMGKAKVKHSFTLIDYSRELNATQKIALDLLQRNTADFVTMLHNLPAVTLDSMRQVMAVPAMPHTRQVLWALSLARFPMLDFLMRTAVRGGEAKNNQELNRMRQAMRMYRNSGTFRMLPPDMQDDVQMELDQIQDHMG